MSSSDVSCPVCGSEMEQGAISGSPWLVWGRPGERAGPLGSLWGAERLARPTFTSSAQITATRCVTCRTGTFTY